MLRLHRLQCMSIKKVNNYNDDIIRGQIKGMFHSMLKTIFNGQKIN